MAAVPTIPTPPRPDATANSDAYLTWLRELLWPDRVERFEGVLVVSPAPTWEHQAVADALGDWLRAWCRRTGLAEAVQAPPLRLSPGTRRLRRARPPDDSIPDVVLWFRDNPRCRRVPSGPGGHPSGWIEGSPDLVVEVGSRRSTAAYDAGTKRPAYARVGVGHVWLVDWPAGRVVVLSESDGSDFQRTLTVPWVDLRWPPGPDGDRWGDHETHPHLLRLLARTGTPGAPQDEDGADGR